MFQASKLETFVKLHVPLQRYIYTTKARSYNKSLDKNVTTSNPKLLRNIGIIAHINAGKTTTTERILYYAGSTSLVGDVDKGNTVTDYLDQERDRGITITSAAVSLYWKKHQINLIDTPGHVDFTIEVERSLSVLDGAITILDASAGVEAQTMTVWNQARKYKIPNIIFLNKYDKPQADYKMCLKSLKDSLGIATGLLQIPVISRNEKCFLSLLNVINRTHITWQNPDKNQGSHYTVETLVDSKLDKKYIELVEEEREKLVNILTDSNDEFSSHVIECERISEVSSEQISKALREATLRCEFYPILVGSSFKYIGVQQLMDAVVDYLPSPIDREEQIVTSSLSSELKTSKDNCAFIFKIMHDKRLGALNYLKVCNGSISRLQKVKSLESSRCEQVKKVYRAFADELHEIDGQTRKGDIVIATGLIESKTGDILVDQNFTPKGFDEKNETSLSDLSIPIRILNSSTIVPQISQLDPVYFCSIESKNSAQQIKLENALACLAREDPSFHYEIDQLGITTIRGMGKLHLEVIRDRIQSEYGIEPLLGPLQISYRETIIGSATEDFSTTRLINSVKNTLTMKLYVRPLANAGAWTGKKLRLDTSGESTLGRLRNDHRKAIENGFLSAMNHGPSLGFPVIDCDILLLDFKANNRCGLPVISSAASHCLTSALKRCSPVVLEPIMLLEVVVPSSYNGVVLGDLSARRGVVLSTTARNLGSSMVIRSRVPLATLADYSEFLRISTSGRGCFSMELHSYSEMSSSDRENIARL